MCLSGVWACLTEEESHVIEGVLCGCLAISSWDDLDVQLCPHFIYKHNLLVIILLKDIALLVFAACSSNGNVCLKVFGIFVSCTPL